MPKLVTMLGQDWISALNSFCFGCYPSVLENEILIQYKIYGEEEDE